MEEDKDQENRDNHKQRGYVTIFRDIDSAPWYTDINTCLLAQHLIRRVNHKPKKILVNKKYMIIKRGQTLTGCDTLERETGLTRAMQRRSLNLLVTDGFIEKKTWKGGINNHGNSLITVCKYDDYQFKVDDEQPQRNHSATIAQPYNSHKQVMIE